MQPRAASKSIVLPRPVRLAAAALGAAALLAAGASPAAAAPQGDCVAGAAWPAARADLSAAAGALANAHRAGAGLAPLVVSPTLTAAAEWKARHMAALGYFAHEDPSPVVRDSSERAQACGYPTVVGENIAAGQTTAAAVMAAWTGSAGHRANLEEPGYRAMGTGTAAGGDGRLYWVQMFGSVADAGSVPTGAGGGAPAPGAPGPGGGDTVVSPAPAPAATGLVRIAGCRRAGATVRCTLRLSRRLRSGRLRARLLRGGRAVGRGTLAPRGRRSVTLRLRASRGLRAGEYTLALRTRAGATRVGVQVR